MSVNSDFNHLPEILTVDEVAAYLRIGRSSVYSAIHAKTIPSVRIGKRILISKAAIGRFVEPPEHNSAHLPVEGASFNEGVDRSARR